ncbi:hypothetical protein BST81_09740 [Leptolyngbya sp. 'hensonii']|uniref:hypothetical protein n=1 Tax=Leptolyngbya sp. 'hensonii' TaxID=1922337 RepID=UPI00094FB168|nr:hypothetical protein [Leptolyngbya sp. 'hensonii']OLP18565.1 hypothetical protein BST81_09740 [Leptolyngbya sp. 'hensonii']
MLITTSADPFTRGLDYLYGARSLALDPEMVDMVYNSRDREPICTWIGDHIDAVNEFLQLCLQACYDCFHPWEQRTVQIFAAPLSPAFGIDGLCNLKTKPTTILIDVGRVIPADWLSLVIHEYAHAHAGSPGHHQQFAEALAHLCLGLEIEPLAWQAGIESRLQSYPHCRRTQNPLSFWRGESRDWRSTITN